MEMNDNIQPLDPIAFALGPIQVHWYGLIIGTGLALALFIAIREGDRRGLPKDSFADLMLWAIPIAILSARLYYVLFEWSYYSAHPGQILQIWNGGLAIHGALIGSVVTAYIFTKKRGISFWKVADIAAPSIILRPSHRPLGKLYESGSPWWRGNEIISRRFAAAGVYHQSNVYKRCLLSSNLFI